MTEETKKANAAFKRMWQTGKYGEHKVKIAYDSSYWQSLTAGQKSYVKLLVKNGMSMIGAINHAYFFGCADGSGDIIDKMIREEGNDTGK